jgi:N-methylhydantoinase B
VTAAGAERIYAVVLRDGRADHAATAALRHRRLMARLREAGSERAELLPARPVPPGVHTVADVYAVDREADRIECHHCGTALCTLGESPKDGMAVLERPVQSLTPGAPDPRTFVDDDVVWRDFLCPGCGVRLATEVAYPGALPFRELELR